MPKFREYTFRCKISAAYNMLNIVFKYVLNLKDSGRVRNVIQGPDESLYVSVEGPGRIIKITPR